MSAELSLIIVKNPVLDPRHLDFLMAALNAQSDRRFNTFWLDQSPGPEDLLIRLKSQARFGWQAYHVPGLNVGGVACWELVHPFAFVLEQPAIGRYFSYLHMECLPDPDFVATILAALSEVEAQVGPRFGCLVQQLWCPLSLADLLTGSKPAEADNLTWNADTRAPYDKSLRGQARWQAQAYEEDAFVLPTALARELKLFSCVQPLLFFQDVFDILAELKLWPATRFPWLRLPGAVLYHLAHERAFLELRETFFEGVRAHPQHFSHLSLWELAHSARSYREDPAYRARGQPDPDSLGELLTWLRCSQRGTLTLWVQALHQIHGGCPERPVRDYN